jgi:hypothetical protein
MIVRHFLANGLTRPIQITLALILLAAIPTALYAISHLIA